MITKRQYENAMATVKRYLDEQSQIKLSKMMTATINRHTRIKDMYYAGVISPRLYGILYRYFDHDVKLEDLSEIDVDRFHLMYGVGERLVNEFKNLIEKYGRHV
jgi:hypothetical protein